MDNDEEETTNKNDDKKLFDNGSTKKLTKKKSKAMKSKLNKIKNVDLTKKNVFNKKTTKPSLTKLNNKPEQDENLNLNHGEIEENPITCSLKHFLVNELTTKETNAQNITINPNYPEWKKKLLNTPNLTPDEYLSLDLKKLVEAKVNLKKSENRKFDNNINRWINTIIDYLKQLIDLIRNKYGEHWLNDRLNGNCTCNQHEGILMIVYSHFEQ